MTQLSIHCKYASDMQAIIADTPSRLAANGHGEEMDEMGTFFLNLALTDR